MPAASYSRPGPVDASAGGPAIRCTSPVGLQVVLCQGEQRVRGSCTLSPTFSGKLYRETNYSTLTVEVR